LMAGGVLVVKKGKLLKEFSRGLDEGRQTFEEELERRLTEKFDRVHLDINNSVKPFFDYLRTREKALDPLVDRGRDIHDRLGALSETFQQQCEN